MSLLLLFQGDIPNEAGWQQPLSQAPRVIGAALLLAASAGLTLPLAPPAAAAIAVPLDAGGAPPRIHNVYYQSRVEVPYAPPSATTTIPVPVDMGGQLPQLRQLYVQSRIEPPYLPAATVNSSGWQAPLSAAPPAAKVQAGFSFIPFNTAQLSVNFTVDGWQGPPAIAPRAAKAPTGFVTAPFVQSAATTIDQWQSPLSLAPPRNRVADVPYPLPIYPVVQAPNTVTIDKWQQPLSVAAPVNRARPGEAFVPFNTVQPVVVYPTGVPLDMGGAPPRINRVYYQSKIETPYITPVPGPVTIPIDLGGQLPQLRVLYAQTTIAPPLLPASVVSISWQAPLSIAPPLAKVTFANQPPVSAPATVNALSWQPPLSVLARHATAQLGSVTQPTYVAPVVLAGIAGMAWFTPLAVPLKMQNKARQSELISITRFDTVAPVGTLPHSKPFFVTPGKLMNI